MYIIRIYIYMYDHIWVNIPFPFDRVHVWNCPLVACKSAFFLGAELSHVPTEGRLANLSPRGRLPWKCLSKTAQNSRLLRPCTERTLVEMTLESPETQKTNNLLSTKMDKRWCNPCAIHGNSVWKKWRFSEAANCNHFWLLGF